MQVRAQRRMRARYFGVPPQPDVGAVPLDEDEENIDGNQPGIFDPAYTERNPAHVTLRDSLVHQFGIRYTNCLLYTSPSPRDRQKSRMPSSA